MKNTSIYFEHLYIIQYTVYLLFSHEISDRVVERVCVKKISITTKKKKGKLKMYLVRMGLKRKCHKIFCQSFFHKSTTREPPVQLIKVAVSRDFFGLFSFMN